MIQYAKYTIKLMLYIVIVLSAIHFSIRAQIFLNDKFPDSILISLSKPMLPICLFGFLFGMVPWIFKKNSSQTLRINKTKIWKLLSLTLLSTIIFLIMSSFSMVYHFSIIIGIISYMLWGVLGFRLSKYLSPENK